MNGGGNPEIKPAAARSPGKIFPSWSWAVLLSALAWVVIFLAIPPSAQNFPLGDDWAFSRGAIWFAQAQGIHYSNWASMPELGQWIWSWPFLHVLHPEHFALRFSVIVLSWAGLIAFYDLLRRAGISERITAFAAGVLALDPLWFISGGTYMTDVPAISFGLVALCFYARALAAKDRRWLWAALFAASFAVITRQTMLAVPLTAGILFWKDREVRWKPFWIFSVVMPVIICGLVARWFLRRPDVLPMAPEFNLKEALLRPFIALHLCGLAVLPLVLLVFRPQNRRHFLISIAVMMLAVVLGLRFLADSLPFGGLFPYCTGMLSLEGTYSDGLVAGQRDILLTPPIRSLLTLLGCVGAAGILTALIETFRAGKYREMLLVFTSVQFIIVLSLPSVTDRYLAVLFPGAIFLVAVRGGVARWRTGLVSGFCYAVISVALMHDWLAWNSARWQLGEHAIAAGKIRPGQIEGGFEWNGWFASADFNHPPAPATSKALDDQLSFLLPFTHYFFPQVAGQFALSFSPPEGAAVLASLPYTRWLPPAQKNFYLVGLPGSKLTDVTGP